MQIRERQFADQRWTTSITEKSVARNLKSPRVVVASRRGWVVGAVRMETKKPWAIDLNYFTPVCKAVYLRRQRVSRIAAVGYRPTANGSGESTGQRNGP
jgi:hypothetical protein